MDDHAPTLYCVGSTDDHAPTLYCVGSTDDHAPTLYYRWVESIEAWSTVGYRNWGRGISNNILDLA
jgi:hypothetical protein